MGMESIEEVDRNVDLQEELSSTPFPELGGR